MRDTQTIERVRAMVRERGAQPVARLLGMATSSVTSVAADTAREGTVLLARERLSKLEAQR